MNNNLLININTYLLTLLPIALVTGPLIPEVIMFITLVIFLFITIREKQYKYYNNNFFKLFIIFFVIINLSTFLNFNLLSLKSSIFYFRVGFLSLAIWHVIDNNPKFIKYFFYTLSLLLIAIFIDSIIQIIFKKNIIGLPISPNGRVSSFFGDELVLGSYLARIFPLFVSLFFVLKLRNKKFLISLLSIFFLINIILASSRVSLSIFILFILIFIIFMKQRKYLIYLLSLFLVIVSISFAFNQTWVKRIFNHTLNQSMENNHFQVHSFRHTLHYLTAWNMFKSKPIFGYGPKSFRLNCNKEEFIPSKYIQKNNSVYAKNNGKINIQITGINYITKTTTLDPLPSIARKNIFNNDDFINFISKKNNKILSENSRKKNNYIFEDEFLYIDIKQFIFSEKLAEIAVDIDLVSDEQNFNIMRNNKNFNFFVNKNLLNDQNLSFKKDQLIIIKTSEYMNGCNTHPHNFYLQFLSEIGVVGFLILLLTYFYIFFVLLFNFFEKENFITKPIKKYLKIKRIDFQSIVILIGYLCILFPLFPSGNFFNNWMSIMFFLPMGFLIAGIYKK